MSSDDAKIKLEEGRAQIDRADKQLLLALNERLAGVATVTEAKKELGLEPYQPERFQKLLEALKQQGKTMDIDEGLIENIWTAIHDNSVNIQSKILGAKNT